MRHIIHIRLIVVLLALVTVTGAVWAQVECTDEFMVEVQDSQLTITHKGALYNCCPEFDYEITLEGDRITVREIETHQGCFCVCCTDLTIEIEDVPAGEYVLEFHWFDYETSDWLVWFDSVILPDIGQGAVDPYVSQHQHSDCYASVPGEEDASSTWGAIKTLYR